MLAICLHDTRATMASVGEKFDAAVTVIKKLPKNGPFQPSFELMKRFYGLYKQATEGPCHETKPAFWNVVQTQKWQAWSVLGSMESEEAKRLYVEELLQIIETMPQTDEVVTFLKVMGPFFELVHEGEPEHVPASSRPQVTKVNGHVNGGVKMKETKVDERGDQARTLQNGDLSDVSDYTNGYLEDDHDLIERSKGKTEQLESSSTEAEVNGHSEEGEVTKEETRESSYVRVVSTHQGENSAELSHPILISKSQLEAAEEHLPSTSESDSDGDEFCDSVDEPLISRISVAHISKTDSLPSVMEEEEDQRKHLTSTPFSGDHAVVTRAEVHNDVDAVILPQYTSSSSSAPTISTPSMRGGGEVTEGSKGHQGQDSALNQSGQGHLSGYVSSDSFQNLRSSGSQDSSDGVGRRREGEGGGAGRGAPGGAGSPLRSPLPDGMVEQITISLERLQRDMNSVLVRLNTLETIAISRHQLETQQAYMREGIPLPKESAPIRTPPQPATPSWWPFSTLPVRTVFILLVWPFIVQWILRFLARHRRARPPPR
ncbi:acyl-CoA-binding domain-containing protein 5 isoform X2 [Strongylocentrotus purpuratus]|uniref:ACB domain-containing protein n=1 Tax=Strongylocentrotus purpuratus TaxID=7668 RepID=A0A7M7MYR2_STRPU|nr:acyl-CoA-binding domain-containing protein 5 isoform X2 [Strongylocentrotus purpuratus]